MRAALQTGGILAVLYVIALFGFGIAQGEIEAAVKEHRWVGLAILAVIYGGSFYLIERHHFMSRSAFQEKVDTALARLTEREAKVEATRLFKAGKRLQNQEKRKK